MLRSLRRRATGFDDFRRNGLLLPCQEGAAIRTGLPLHRGPHKRYNSVVAERVAGIELDWLQRKPVSPRSAECDALSRIDLLQRALRRRLLSQSRRRFLLNRKDPIGSGQDFSELDAMAEALWCDTSR